MSPCACSHQSRSPLAAAHSQRERKLSQESCQSESTPGELPPDYAFKRMTVNSDGSVSTHVPTKHQKKVVGQSKSMLPIIARKQSLSTRNSMTEGQKTTILSAASGLHGSAISESTPEMPDSIAE